MKWGKRIALGLLSLVLLLAALLWIYARRTLAQTDGSVAVAGPVDWPLRVSISRAGARPTSPSGPGGPVTGGGVVGGGAHSEGSAT